MISVKKGLIFEFGGCFNICSDGTRSDRGRIQLSSTCESFCLAPGLMLARCSMPAHHTQAHLHSVRCPAARSNHPPNHERIILPTATDRNSATHQITDQAPISCCAASAIMTIGSVEAPAPAKRGGSFIASDTRSSPPFFVCSHPKTPFLLERLEPFGVNSPTTPFLLHSGLGVCDLNNPQNRCFGN